MVNIEEINELLGQGLSVTAVCKKLKIPKTSLLRNLKKDGYVLNEKDGIKVYELITECLEQKESSPELVATSPQSEPDSLSLDNLVIEIKTGLKSIVNSFVDISINLRYIYKNELYKEKYSNIVDFANSEFDLSREQTYRFISIANKYIDDKNSFDSAYVDYSYSQLVEMLNMPSELEKEVTPDMTVKQIREKKKQKKENKEEVSCQIEGQQAFVEAEYQSVNDEQVQDKSNEKIKITLTRQDIIDLLHSVKKIEKYSPNEIERYESIQKKLLKSL